MIAIQIKPFIIPKLWNIYLWDPNVMEVNGIVFVVLTVLKNDILENFFSKIC